MSDTTCGRRFEEYVQTVVSQCSACCGKKDSHQTHDSVVEKWMISVAGLITSFEQAVILIQRV